MRKISFLMIAITIIAVIFSGCSSNNASQDSSTPTSIPVAENATPASQNDQSTPNNTYLSATINSTGSITPAITPTDMKTAKNTPAITTKSTSKSSMPTRMPGSKPGISNNNGQRNNFTRADLMGEIASVNGNTFTIKLMETPKFNGNSTPSKDHHGNTGIPQGRTPNYSGETKKLTIPSGTPITTTVRSENGRETKNIELKEIKVGDIIQIWYTDKQKGIISKVSIGSFRRN